MRKVTVIGGGASGMMAAIAAAEEAKEEKFPLSVTILEQNDRPGKKILATGNGSCNLSNEKMDDTCYRSDAPEVVRTVLESFGVRDTLDFFEDLGVWTKSRDGYLYPRNGQARTVRDALLMRLNALGVEILESTRVTGLCKKNTGFSISVEQKKGGLKQGRRKSPALKELFSDKVILAAGGKAASKFGSDGSGYALAKEMGHTLSNVVPALVQLKVKGHPFNKVTGVRTPAKVTALVDGQAVAEDTGELQMVSLGLSGIPIFQISRYIAKALAAGEKAEVAIDFLPEIEEDALAELFLDRRKIFGQNTAGEYLEGVFNSQLCPRLLELAGIRTQEKAGRLTDDQIRKLAAVCKRAVVPVCDTNGFENAQVCAGGVRLTEVDPKTMESLFTPGLYLTGELLDADGICGGYNLQWAWATGFMAGKAVAGAFHGEVKESR